MKTENKCHFDMEDAQNDVSSLPAVEVDSIEDLRRKTEIEVEETGAFREKRLHQLRLKIKLDPTLNPSHSDEFLLLFLRFKSFDVQASCNTIRRLYAHMRLYPSLHAHYSREQQQQRVMRHNIMTFLPKRTPEGYALWAVRFGLWDPSECTFEDLLRFGLMCNALALRNTVTQVHGISSVVDLKGLSWSHLTHISASDMRCYVAVAQDCFPIRHKAIHVINNPAIFGILFAMIKPLLSKKIRGRIHFHGSNLSNLHAFVPPDILPEVFGGTAGTFGNEAFTKSLITSEDVFRECNTFEFHGSPNPS